MAYVMPGATGSSPAKANWQLGAVIAAGALGALFLGAYAALHPPAAQATFGFSAASMLSFKSWMTTLSVALAVVQLLSALRIRERIRWPRTAPMWLPDLHRLVGTLAVVSSLPVAYHCLWSLGFQFTDEPMRSPRVLVHAVAGCFFYGVFVTKVLTVRIATVPRWMLPVAGGAVFASVVLVWLTSAAFFLTGHL